MMAIELGGLSFDSRHVAVKETMKEAGGRDTREITLSGFLVPPYSGGDRDAMLTSLLAEVGTDGFDTALSIRAGRRLWVRRTGFRLEPGRPGDAGGFVLSLESSSSLEESTTEKTLGWPVTGSGATQLLTNGGTGPAPVVVSLLASGELVAPSVGDGTRTIRYGGSVAAGETLVFDGRAGSVLLEGADVTGYSAGVFPLAAPGGSTLWYEDDVMSSHQASGLVRWRDVWR